MAKATKPKRRRKAPTREDRDREKRELLEEIAHLTDQQDAIKSAIAVRKDRLLLLMHQDGDRSVEAENVAAASFTRRRSFKLKDTTALARMFTKEQLVEHVRVTAAFYDAAIDQGYRIDMAVTMGEDESLTVSRAKTKEAKKIRDACIAESRKVAEAKLAEYREKLKAF